MRSYETVTVTLPRSSFHSYPMASEMEREAEAFARHLETVKKYALEDALRDGTASTVDKIKAAWSSFGDPSAFDRYGYVQRVMAPQPLPVSFMDDCKANLGPCPYETFDFQREVTRNKDFTVTRIHCGGLTVYEKVEETH